MTDTYKKLAAIAPTNDEEKFLYAAPAATSSLVSNITVANRSSSSATFDINIYQSGITQQSDIDNSDLGKKFFIAAVNGDGGIKTSTNGTTWISAGQAYNEFSGKVLYGNGIYIVPVGNPGTAKVSTDGITWTNRTDSGLAQKVRAAAFGAGIFVWSAIFKSHLEKIGLSSFGCSSKNLSKLRFLLGLFIFEISLKSKIIFLNQSMS